MASLCSWVSALHLVRTVDFGSVLQQQFDDVGVSSARRPDDGIHTVLLREHREKTRLHFTQRDNMEHMNHVIQKMNKPSSLTANLCLLLCVYYFLIKENMKSSI